MAFLDSLKVNAGNDKAFLYNDWSFSQICRRAGVAKDTVNRLSPSKASLVLGETLPIGQKPVQMLTDAETIRSIDGMQYTRLSVPADRPSGLARFVRLFARPRPDANLESRPDARRPADGGPLPAPERPGRQRPTGE